MDFWQQYLPVKHLILNKIAIKWNDSMDPVSCVVLELSMVYAVEKLLGLQKILAAEQGCSRQHTMFIFSTYSLKACIDA